jgi:hypothetical protein
MELQPAHAVILDRATQHALRVGVILVHPADRHHIRLARAE